MRSLPPAFRNFYLLAALSFVFLMVFLDTPGLLMQWRLSRELRGLQEREGRYKEKLEKIKKEYELVHDPRHVERLARERYLMKKRNEDLYVVSREQ